MLSSKKLRYLKDDPMVKSQSQKVTKEDVQLAELAKKKAGGPALLAKVFGVTLPAASEWGRTRPIPRHVRPRLENYVKPGQSAPPEEATGSSEASPALVRELLRVLEPALASSRLVHLPSRYRKRYEERAAEAIARVKRELDEYQAVLEAEHRTGPRRRRRSGN
jgi:hypothetical protein